MADRDSAPEPKTERNGTYQGRAPIAGRSRNFLRDNPRRRNQLLVGLLVALAAVALFFWHSAGHVSTDDAQIDGHITPISARVGGTVQSVQVNDNQVVQAGDVLVQVDPRDYQVALARAEAELANARAAEAGARTGVPITSATTASQLSTAHAGIGRARAGIAVADARLSAAQARLQEAIANNERAGRDLERMKQLVAKDEVSQQQYDMSVAAAAAARAAVDSARASVIEAEQGREDAASVLAQAQAGLQSAQTAPEQVAVIRSRAEAAAAQLQQAEATAEQARLNLQYATVKAPAAGMVSRRTVEPGQIVQAGQPLLALVPLEDIWVTANFKETQLRNVRPGQKASIKVDAYGRTYEGHVDSISPATGARFSLLPPENATGNYVKVVQRVPVKIVFEGGQDPQRLLRPGMSVVPTIFTR